MLALGWLLGRASAAGGVGVGGGGGGGAAATPAAAPPPPSPAALPPRAHARRAEAAPGSGPVVVGVCGASGSGKTSLAAALASELAAAGVRATVLSCDSYYLPLPAGADAAAHNFDAPAALDLGLLAGQLAALRRGEDAAVPQYDFAAHARLAAATRVPARATDVIVVDGLFVLADDRVAAQCDLAVFCAEDNDVCLARRLRRDVAERGRTADSVIAQYLKFVKAGFEQHVAPSMAKADLIIPRARDNTVAIAMLVRELQRRVEARGAAGGAAGSSDDRQQFSTPVQQAS